MKDAILRCDGDWTPPCEPEQANLKTLKLNIFKTISVFTYLGKLVRGNTYFVFCSSWSY